MTLVAAWVRRNGSLHELVVASDSRISGGESWNVCPKVMRLPRPATLIAMSGDAVEAYAFQIQAANTCELLDGNQSGQTDIAYLARKLRDAYADMRSHVTDLDSSGVVRIPELDVALFGWSWRRLRYEGFSYRYNRDGVLWMDRLDHLEPSHAYPCHMFGDASGEARRLLKKIVKDRAMPVPHTGDPNARAVAGELFYDWEPLEVLLEMVDDPGVRSVGGVPQVAKIYQYGISEPFVWRDSSGTDFFGGRPVQPAERFDRRVIRFLDGRVHIQHSDRSIAFGGADADNEEADEPALGAFPDAAD